MLRNSCPLPASFDAPGECSRLDSQLHFSPPRGQKLQFLCFTPTLLLLLNPHFPPWQSGIPAAGSEQSVRQMMQRKGWGGRNGFRNDPCTEPGSQELLFVLPAAKHRRWEQERPSVAGPCLCAVGHAHFTGITFGLFPLPTAPPGPELPPGHCSCLSSAHLQGSAPPSVPGFLQFPRSGLARGSLRWFLCWDGSKTLCSFGCHDRKKV